MKPFQKTKQAFTLIELIVVITILVILATIAFISFKGYSSHARNSKRISDINSLGSTLVAQIAKGQSILSFVVGTTESRLINPSIAGSNTTTGNDYDAGYVNYGPLSVKSSDFQDPSDNSSYAIGITTRKNGKYELSANMEQGSGPKIAKLIGNYSQRTNASIPIQTGSVLSIITIINDTDINKFFPSDTVLPNGTSPVARTITKISSDGKTITLNGNVPNDATSLALNAVETTGLIQGQDGTSTGIIQDGGLFLSYNSSTPYSGGYIVTCGTAGQIISATSTYSGCNTADIIVCSGIKAGYTLSACNVGATTASPDWNTSRGSYFQWGRNKGFAYGDSSQQSTTIAGSTGLNAGTDSYGFVWNPFLASPYTWANSNITNNWGDTTNTVAARQGPCASGYHVPTHTEWLEIVNAGGWGTNGTNMQTALKLPLAGIRSRYNGALYGGNSYGYYRTSSPIGTGAYALGLDASGIYPNDNGNRAVGFSVRCFKN